MDLVTPADCQHRQAPILLLKHQQNVELLINVQYNKNTNHDGGVLMAYCKSCGAYIPDGQTACLACGYNENTEQKKTSAASSGAAAAANAAQRSSTSANTGKEKYRQVDSDFLKQQLDEQRRRQQENSRKWAETEYAQRQKAKEEFLRINLSPNNIVPEHRLNYFNLVLDSSNYVEFLNKYYNNELENKDLEFEKVHRQYSNLENINIKLRDERKNKNLKIEEYKNQNIKLEKEVKKLRKFNDSLINSKSWKITKPFRSLMYFIRKLL